MSMHPSPVDKSASRSTNVSAQVENAVGADFDMGRFLDNFAVLAESEGGTAALRRLIVDLGVRGALVSRYVSDGSGADLAETIRCSREASVSRRRGQQGQADLEVTAEPFDIPSSWSWITMGDMAAKLGAGSTPLGGKSVYKASGIKFLRSQNVWNQGLKLADVAFIDRAIHVRMAGTHVEPGDILLNITGASIGRTAIVPDDFDEGNVSQHVAIVRLVDKSIRRFVHLAMTSTYFQSFIMAVQVGVSREGLSMNKLQHLSIPLPPLAEQKRIVARVDQLMALCDELEAKQAKKRETGTRLTKSALEALTSAEGPEEFDVAWKRVVENFDVLIDRADKVKELRTTILNLAFRGRLVAPTNKDRAPDDYLQRILRVKPENLSVSAFAPGWMTCAIGNAFEVGTGSTPTRTNPEYWTGGTIPWVTSTATGFETISAGNAFVTSKAVAEFRLKLFPKGSLVVALYGQGKTRGQVSKLLIDACVNQACAVIQVPASEPVLQKFVWLHFRQQYDAIRELAEGGAQPNLNVGKIKESSISFPPLREMEHVVNKVDQLMKICDDLEAKLRRAEDRASKLVEAVVLELVA